jgi:hypothetical protein
MTVFFLIFGVMTAGFMQTALAVGGALGQENPEERTEFTVETDDVIYNEEMDMFTVRNASDDLSNGEFQVVGARVSRAIVACEISANQMGLQFGRGGIGNLVNFETNPYTTLQEENLQIASDFGQGLNEPLSDETIAENCVAPML